MNYFWGNVFEYFKDRRLGVVFFGSLAALVGTLIVGAIIYQVILAYDLQEYVPMVLPGIGVILVGWIWRGIRRWRACQADRYKSSPLSRDEKVKARSKLKTTPTFKKL